MRLELEWQRYRRCQRLSTYVECRGTRVAALGRRRSQRQKRMRPMNPPRTRTTITTDQRASCTATSLCVAYTYTYSTAREASRRVQRRVAINGLPETNPIGRNVSPKLDELTLHDGLLAVAVIDPINCSSERGRRALREE